MTNSKDAISLDLIKTFAVFAEVGSVDLAAESLGLTQAAVSFQLKRLEKEMGRPLFQTLGRRKVLNTFGLDLFQQLAPPLKNLESALKEVSAKTKASHRPSLRLQCSSLLAMAFNNVLEISSDCEIDSSCPEHKIQFENNDVDLWLTLSPPPSKSRWLTIKIFEFKLVVAAKVKNVNFTDDTLVLHSSVHEWVKARVALGARVQVYSDWMQVRTALNKDKSWTVVPDFSLSDLELTKLERNNLDLSSDLGAFLSCPAQFGAELLKKVRKLKVSS